MATPIPVNQASFTALEVCAATGARCRGPRATRFTGVTSDSRRVVAGNLFVALTGENFDGHRFAHSALKSGALGVLVEREVEDAPEEKVVLKAESTLSALGALGNLQRRRSAARIIGVAGSAGKTTTKTLVAAALEGLAPRAVHVSAGNLNNQVGVPFVLLGLTKQHRFGVVEIGTNQAGEVEKLSKIAEPDIGLLTLIGLEHSEGLGDIDSIELEEAALLANLPREGAIVFNADDARVCRQVESCQVLTKIGYGRSPRAGYQLLQRTSSGLAGSRLEVARPDGQVVTLESPLLGEAGALAVLAAFATLELCQGRPVSPRDFSASLADPKLLPEGRLRVITLADGCIVVDDSYNSNPASVGSSLEVAREVADKGQRRLLLVLGEMRELGRFAIREHRRLGTCLAAVQPALVVAVAGDALHLVEPARQSGVRAEFVETSEEALQLLSKQLKPGDVVLIKASRGVRAETVVNGLIADRGLAQ